MNNNLPKTAPTPQEIVQKLDQYIIGQQDAKKQLAVAYRNKWRRSQVTSDLQREIVPTNMLIIGPTGTGKTECARRLAGINSAPFIKVEAPRFTERGYVGSDVNEIIRGLTDNAFAMIKKEKQKKVKAKALQNVEEIILETLIPLTGPGHENPTHPPSLTSKELTNQETRERFRKKLQRGEMDDYKIEIRFQAPSNPMNGMGFIGGTLDESTMGNLQNLFSNFLPKSTKKKKVTIQEAQKILLEEEMNNLLDIETIKEEAIIKTENEGIVFIDEIDKIASSNQKNHGQNVSREGVQRDLLPLVEGTTVPTKYGRPVNTDHILFIAAGAFHIAQPSDLLPELQGRFPIRVKLDALSEKDFERILQEPANSLIKQYQALFAAEDVKLTFDSEAIKEIAHFAFKSNENMENIGARRLRTVLNHLLSEFLFDVPEKIGGGEDVHIEKAMVEQRLSSIVKEADHGKYIL